MRAFVYITFSTIISAALGDRISLSPFPNSNYLKSSDERSFRDALLECHENNYDLLSVDDPEEGTIIKNILRESKDNNYYWTSGTDLHSELRFVWSASGKPVDILDLTGNFQKFSGIGRCIQTVFVNNSLHLLLELCEKKFLFICEERVQCGNSESQEVITVGGTKIQDGKIVQHNQIKYFVSSERLQLSWTSAYTYCTNLGMQLWSIETETENKLIDRVNSTGEYWTSATDIGDSGNWIWMTTGEELGNIDPPPEANALIFSWSEWARGKRNLSSEVSGNYEQHCLFVKMRKLWNDEPCSNKKSFICEPKEECE